ncbi:sensor histidine kinase [Halovenus sp. WSH3]|uniref:histidine kinase n=1 Tax=Halovenus carboxidivorans TaxID=2692199 RepID=A0A6B0TA92_9EURY|nr:HAMP domain-containing sensor histidine kinase [Halovenus carboxidivorans]MXR52292.1 sensor histidine kinase [Halovenus carboxidivorans]
MTANESWSLPMERYPDPACSYAFEDDRAVVQASNEQFGRISGLSAGDPLADGFGEELPVLGDQPSFDRSGRCWVRDPDHRERRYLVRIIAPENDQPGHLVFNAVDQERESQNVGVDRVASVLSHDLRNPLDVARARLRAGRELESEEHFDHVEQAHDRMERIIQDVLTLARGEDVVNPEEVVDLDAVVRNAWQTVETNGATLDVVEDLPEATADRDRVTRLFENLFRNAVEHGPPETEEEHITISVGRLPDGLFVADDGVGIPPENRERVFEPGFSSDDHGTGLGLAIVARIVDLHGWSVRVTDSETGGARFEIVGLDPE